MEFTYRRERCVICLDSWVWLEFIFSGDKADEAESLIDRANTAEEGGLIAPTTIAEVSYRVRVVEGREAAKEAVRAIRDFQYIESMPLIDDIAEYAAELRFRYYEPGERELSYADAIHVYALYSSRYSRWFDNLHTRLVRKYGQQTRGSLTRRTVFCSIANSPPDGPGTSFLPAVRSSLPPISGLHRSTQLLIESVGRCSRPKLYCRTELLIRSLAPRGTSRIP